ncbi:RNA polymerase sigma factor, partial [Nostoc sp.]
NTGGWVYKVCHYVVVEHIRKNSNTATFTSNGNSSLDKVPALSESSEDLNFNNVRLDQYNKVKKALKKLNPRSREILEFVEIDKWSYEEIAEYLTKKYGEYRTVQALRKQKSRALKQLKTIYEQLT